MTTAQAWNSQGFKKRKREQLSDEDFKIAQIALEYDTNPSTVRRWQEEARGKRVLDDDRRYRELLEQLGRSKNENNVEVLEG